MTSNTTATDPRTPSPPYGYSRECTYSLEQQVAIVAEFHANKIRPSRIAYRVGIDIDLVEKLIAGEAYQETFAALVARYRRNRRSQRLQDSRKLSGVAQSELQQIIELEYQLAAEYS